MAERADAHTPTDADTSSPFYFSDSCSTDEETACADATVPPLDTTTDVFLDARLVPYSRTLRCVVEDYPGAVEDREEMERDLRLVKSKKYEGVVRALNDAVCFDPSGRLLLAQETTERANKEWFAPQVIGELLDLLPELVECLDFYDFDILLYAPVLYALVDVLGERGRSFSSALFLQEAPERKLPEKLCALIANRLGLHETVWQTLGPEASDVLRFAFTRCGDPVESGSPYGISLDLTWRIVPDKIAELKQFVDERVNIPKDFRTRDKTRNGSSEALNNTARGLNCALQLLDEIKKDLTHTAHTCNTGVGIAADKAFRKVHKATMPTRIDCGPHIRRVVVTRRFETLDKARAYQASADRPGLLHRPDPMIHDRANDDYKRLVFRNNNSGSRKVTLFSHNTMGLTQMPGHGALGVSPVFINSADGTSRCTTRAPRLGQHLNCDIAIPGRMRYKSDGIYSEYDYSETLMGNDGVTREAYMLLRTSPGIMELARNIRAAVMPLMILLRIAQRPAGDVWQFEDAAGYVLTVNQCKSLAGTLRAGQDKIDVPVAFRRFARVRDELYPAIVSALKTLLLGFYSYEFSCLHVAHRVDAAYEPEEDMYIASVSNLSEKDRTTTDINTRLLHITQRAEVLEHIETAMRFHGASTALSVEQILETLEGPEQTQCAIDPRCLCVPLLSALDFATPRYDPDSVEPFFARGESASGYRKRGTSELDNYDPTRSSLTATTPLAKRFRYW